MRSRNTENADERHDQEKSSINDTHPSNSKLKWQPPKLKRVDINTTSNGGESSNDTGSLS